MPAAARVCASAMKYAPKPTPASSASGMPRGSSGLAEPGALTQHDGEQCGHDADDGERARMLAAKDEPVEDRDRRAEHRADRRHDAHRSDGETAIQARDRDRAGHAAQRAPHQIAGHRLATEERHHESQQNETGRLRPQDDRERRRAAAGEAAQKIRAAVHDRGDERERDRHASARVRVERFAQPVAEQVEAEHERRDREAGEDQRPGRGYPVVARVVEHRAPFGRRRPRAQAQIR